MPCQTFRRHPARARNFVGDRPARLDHVRLELGPRSGRQAPGRHRDADADRAPRSAGASTFDAVELDVESVTVDGRAAAFDNDGETLRVDLPASRQPRARSSWSRSATPASRGAASTSSAPTPSTPIAPLQCWTQGQDEDSRHYWPCIDHPIEKSTTEVICTAPAGKFVLSNGVLRERTELPERARPLALRARRPAARLPGDAGGRRVRRDRRPRAAHRRRRLLLRPARPRGRRAPQLRPHAGDDRLLLASASASPTPYPRYSQIIVAEFIFGGMENTSATTLTDSCCSTSAPRSITTSRRWSRTSWRTSGSAICSPAASGPRAGSTKASPPTSSTSGASTPRGATRPTSSCSSTPTAT